MSDVVQLIIWAVLGMFITWGIFFAFVGFRSRAKTSRVAKTSAVISFVVGIFFIVIWGGAVVYNFLQVIGVVPT